MGQEREKKRLLVGETSPALHIVGLGTCVRSGSRTSDQGQGYHGVPETSPAWPGTVAPFHFTRGLSSES